MGQIGCRKVTLYNGEEFPVFVNAADFIGHNVEGLVNLIGLAPPLDEFETFDKQFKWISHGMAQELDDAELLTPHADYTTRPDPIFFMTEFARHLYLERFHRVIPEEGLERPVPYLLSMLYLSTNAIATEDESKFDKYSLGAREKYEGHSLQRSRFAIDEADYNLDSL